MLPRTKSKLPLLSLGLFLLLFLRAWTRLLYPEVWDEDGAINIPGFLNSGIRDLAEPVNGFLILVPKLITMTGVSISITQYPLVSTLMAWCVIMAVLVVVATAPVRLAGGALLAIACLWVPTDSEVFGLPLYTFWWSSLLLFIAVFWIENSTAWGWRASFIVLASLSGPVCLVVFPLFWVRSWLFRNNPIELRLAVIATVSAGIQLYVVQSQHANHTVASGLSHIDFSALVQVIPKFLGAYAVGNIWPKWQTPVGIAVLALISLMLFRTRRSWWMWMLAYLWLMAVIMSVSRVDIRVIHQALAGPRYFFFPFLLLSWWLIQILFAADNRWLRGCGGLLLALAAINVFPVLSRKHDPLHWRTHVLSCQQFEHYILPVHSEGRAEHAWQLPMTGQQCSRLIAEDIFYTVDGSPMLPYRVIGKANQGVMGTKLAGSSSILESEWHGQDYYSMASGVSTLPKVQILGSFRVSAAESGALTLQLERGDQVWYRSELRSNRQRIEVVNQNCKFLQLLPNSSEWVLLEFSNRQLPDKFVVKFIDGGDGWGEWSAVGLSSSVD